jgi:hypothetical protein
MKSNPSVGTLACRPSWCSYVDKRKISLVSWWLVAAFDLARQKYSWLVGKKPTEQAVTIPCMCFSFLANFCVCFFFFRNKCVLVGLSWRGCTCLTHGHVLVMDSRVLYCFSKVGSAHQ